MRRGRRGKKRRRRRWRTRVWRGKGKREEKMCERYRETENSVLVREIGELQERSVLQ